MRRLTILIIATGLIAGGCSSDGPPGSDASAEGYAEWAEAGVSLEHPEGWDPTLNGSNGTVEIQGPDGQQMFIRPFFVPSALTDQAAAAALEEVGAGMLAASWGAPAGTAPAVRMSGLVGEQDAVAALAWTSSDSGSAGYVYAATAPDYEAAEGSFAHVLESFEVTGTTEPDAEPVYEPFTDPTEGAFSAEVPDGWDVDGGVVRPCPTLVQGYVQASASDLSAYIKLGSDYPWFTEPAPSLFLPEGSTYPHPCGYQSPVLRYLPGESFVTEWLLPTTLPEATIVRAEGRSDLASQLTSMGINSYDAGEVEYEWEADGELRRGLIVVITERFSFGGGGAWAVWRLAQAEASGDVWSEALAAGEHLVSTFTIDPNWAQSQAQLTAAQARIIADMGATVAQTVSEGYWGQQATYDAIFEARSDATLEVEDFVDPVTGDTYELAASPQYYWIDPAGYIVGTDTSAKPNVDFRELVAID